MLNNKVGCYSLGVYGIYFIRKIQKFRFYTSFAPDDHHHSPIISYKKLKLIRFLHCSSYDGRLYGSINQMFVQKAKNIGMLNVE